MMGNQRQIQIQIPDQLGLQRMIHTATT